MYRYAPWEEVPEDYWSRITCLNKLLDIAANGNRNVLIVIDALNQLDGHVQRSHRLDWLPRELPVGIKMIVSCLEGEPLDTLRSRSCPEVNVGQLTTFDRKEIVTQSLANYNKKLEEQQIELLLNKKDAVNPLYLVIACEELRIFGIYEKLTDKVKQMADTTPALIEQVLERLETEHGRDLVKKSLSLIHCSRSGVLETEVIEILQVTSSAWSSLLLSLEFFLRPLSKSAGEGRLDFFHRQVAKAVQKRYLDKEPSLSIETHKSLASYFLNKADPEGDRMWKCNNARPISELAYHLTMANMTDQAATVLCNLKFIEKKALFGLAYELVNDFAKLSEMPGVSNDRIRHFKDFVLGNIHIITRFPKLVIQQAYNLPTVNVVTISAGSKCRMYVKRD